MKIRVINELIIKKNPSLKVEPVSKYSPTWRNISLMNSEQSPNFFQHLCGSHYVKR